jgi:hypothetical protein
MIRSAVFIFALTTQAIAAEPPLWVLIGLDGHMGPTITYRDTARDADIHVDEGFQPSRPRQLARQPYAMRIKKYEGKSHGEGNYGRFLCLNYYALIPGQ